MRLNVEELKVETLDVDFGHPSVYAESIIWKTNGEPVTDNCTVPTPCCV